MYRRRAVRICSPRSAAGSAPNTNGRNPPASSRLAWIDGRYCPVGEARISVLDLGVTRSDCTYDVVHVWEGRFYRLDAQIGRAHV